jgi:hypothetical protein
MGAAFQPVSVLRRCQAIPGRINALGGRFRKEHGAEEIGPFLRVL